MNKVYVNLIIILLILVVILIWYVTTLPSKHDPLITEDFIHKWLKNENGTLATYILEGETVDEDLVKGREVLSETIGLWMQYAFEKDDQVLFDKSYQLLHQYFVKKDGFVNWKLNEKGNSEVSTNALIDDLRLASILLKASDQWNDKRYKGTASIIIDYVEEYNVNKGVFTDFYEREDKYASEFITLSYIDAKGLKHIESELHLPPNLVDSTISVLSNAPLDNGFYPKAYNVEEKKYQYDDDINLVDQALIALHQAEFGMGSEEFLQFIKSEMDKNGIIYGVYNRNTKQPAVDYQSPAIYGITIMYCLEVGEHQLANDIYKQMIKFQEGRKGNQYYGGFSIHEGDTHIFDNLLPLLSKQQIREKKK
ncbi:glycosyl hydrolase family 8 [Halobacillus seohaensis]|uniref:Glycosyl hydrolase family 8 n=1 Tax=Halobacillus seohaensis TaxID=447421 RepID=A0ABW2EQM0_9BACI